MSHLNLGRSYAVLLGLEGYLDAKKHAKTAEQGLKDMFDQEAKKSREEAAKDKSTYILLDTNAGAPTAGRAACRGHFPEFETAPIGMRQLLTLLSS